MSKEHAQTTLPQPRRNDGGEPCGECHVKAGETCDICGAVGKAVHTWKSGEKAMVELRIGEDRSGLVMIKGGSIEGMMLPADCLHPLPNPSSGRQLMPSDKQTPTAVSAASA